MRRTPLIVTVLLSILMALAVTGQAVAQSLSPTVPPAGYPSDNDVNQIAKKLYCPVCPNTPLDVCETQACKDWRAQIREQLSAGWTEAQVIDYFVKQYGERVLAEPERKGFTSLVWIIPVLLTLIGFAFVWLVLRGWLATRRARQATSIQPQSASTSKIPPEVLAKIEAEIRNID